MNNQIQNIEQDEIDLVELLKKIWDAKRFILKTTLYSIILGLLVALLTPNEFTASTTFVPQTSSGNSPAGNLSGLASLAGINLGDSSSGGEISPTLYPQILNSIPTKRAIIEIDIPLDSQVINYGEYTLNRPLTFLNLIKKYTLGLPRVIRGEEESQSTSYGSMSVSIQEEKLFEILENQINLTVNDKDGYIELNITTDDPVVSAILTSNVNEILQAQIIDFKIQHAKEFLSFTEKQYNEKQIEYFNLLDEVAKARDANKNIISEFFQNQFKQKEGELAIAQSVYQELAKQLEQAKLQVAKDTPIFSTIKPVTIPTKKSAPKRLLILVIWTMLGIIVSIGITLIKEPLKTVWKEINP